MNLKQKLLEIKQKAENLTDVEFYDQHDTRDDFQDIADQVDTVIDQLDRVPTKKLFNFYNDVQKAMDEFIDKNDLLRLINAATERFTE